MTWDEPDLLQHVKCVNPWLVELVSNMPTVHFSPVSPQQKKPRLLQRSDFPLNCHLPMPGFPDNHFLPNDTPAGMQGARHAQYGLSLSDIHLNKLHSSLFHVGFPPLDQAAAHPRPPNSPMIRKPCNSENISCLLTMGNSTQDTTKKSDIGKAPQLVLFGQPILTEQQISLSCSGDTVSTVRTGNSSSDGNADKIGNVSDGSGSALNQRGLTESSPRDTFQSEPNTEIGHCKVFMESEDVGRTLDLSSIGSYEELCRKLANMFGIENSEMLSHVLYRDITGTVKQLGDEPYRCVFNFPIRMRYSTLYPLYPKFNVIFALTKPS